MITFIRVVRRPVEVQAMQYNGSNAIEIADWMKCEPTIKHGYLMVGTREGTAAVKSGDWVVRESANDYYPVTNDMFWKLYRWPTEVVEWPDKPFILASPKPRVLVNPMDGSYVVVLPGRQGDKPGTEPVTTPPPSTPPKEQASKGDVWPCFADVDQLIVDKLVKERDAKRAAGNDWMVTGPCVHNPNNIRIVDPAGGPDLTASQEVCGKSTQTKFYPSLRDVLDQAPPTSLEKLAGFQEGELSKQQQQQKAGVKVSGVKDDQAKGEAELDAMLTVLRKHGIKQAVDELPYDGREGGFQFTMGPQVETEDMREYFPDVSDEQWPDLEYALNDVGPFFRDDGEEGTELDCCPHHRDEPSHIPGAGLSEVTVPGLYSERAVRALFCQAADYGAISGLTQEDWKTIDKLKKSLVDRIPDPGNMGSQAKPVQPVTQHDMYEACRIVVGQGRYRPHLGYSVEHGDLVWCMEVQDDNHREIERFVSGEVIETDKAGDNLTIRLCDSTVMHKVCIGEFIVKFHHTMEVAGIEPAVKFWERYRIFDLPGHIAKLWETESLMADNVRMSQVCVAGCAKVPKLPVEGTGSNKEPQ